MYIAQNDAYGTLAIALAPSDTTLTLATGNGARFPVIVSPDYTKITIEDADGNKEIVRVTAHASNADTFTIERAQEGTLAQSWGVGDIVELRITAGILNEAVAHFEDTDGAHNASAISFNNSGTDFTGDDVQEVLGEVNAKFGTLDSSISDINDNIILVSSALDNHINDTSGAHDSTAIDHGAETLSDYLDGLQAEVDAIIPAETADAKAGTDDVKFITSKSAHEAIESASGVYGTTGVAPAYILTPDKELTAYDPKVQYLVKFHEAGSFIQQNTINISGLGVKNVMQYNVLGEKVNAAITAGMVSFLAYDGTDFILLNRITNPSSDPVVTLLSTNGYNSMMIIADGVLYHANGAQSALACTTSGYSNNGELPLWGLEQFTQVPVPDTSPVVDAASYSTFAFALCENGNLYTWGGNNAGQCGLGSTSFVRTPTLASTNVTKVFHHPSNINNGLANNKLIIQKSDGYLYGAGYNGYGNLGTGDTTNRTTFTQLTAFGTNPISVWNLGSQYGCLIVETSTGDVYVCGYGASGQLGIGSATNVNHPTLATNNWKNNIAHRIKNVTGGFGRHNGTTSFTYGSIVMHIDDEANGYVKTCGEGQDGVLGTGATSDISTPNTLTFPAKIKQMSGIGDSMHTVRVLLETGVLYTWGQNIYGQCGTTGIGGSVLSPTAVLTGVDALLLNGYSTNNVNGWFVTNYVRLNNGKTMACGRNAQGNIGNGDNADSGTFVEVMIPGSIQNKVEAMGSYSTTHGGSIVVAKTTNNKLYGWGYNAHNGVAVGSTASVLKPMRFKLKEW